MVSAAGLTHLILRQIFYERNERAFPGGTGLILVRALQAIGVAARR
jgi:hypothetical protein